MISQTTPTPLTSFRQRDLGENAKNLELTINPQKMGMRGTLFTYYAPDRLTAFESEPEDSPNTVVFIGGLGDGYMAVPYLSMLQSRLASMHWSLIQVQLSSSYTGYGISDLQTDCDELDRLVHFLRTKRNKQKIVFLGHSTGSQDCYWHNKHGTAAALVDGFVLQAPVSDREYYYKTHASSHERHLALAEEMRATGRGEELMPRGICPIPTTADRFYSLVAFGQVSL